MIQIDNVNHQYGRQILLIEASASLMRGEKIGLVGPNGAGKTTLFRLITGEEEPDGGRVTVERGLRVGYFSQDTGEMRGQTVLAATLDGAGPVAALAQELKSIEDALADPSRVDEMDDLLVRFGDVQARFDTLGGYALEASAREILAGLGLVGDPVDDDVGKLSGGWKMRVALARILLMAPDVLLLDEPSNHLDIESIIWLEGFLQRFEGALLMTTHDREFMDRVVSKVIEIDGGDLISYGGNCAFYETERAQRDQQAAASFARQQAMLAKEEKFIARFKARASHAAQVQSRQKKLEKIDRLEPPRRRETQHFELKTPPRSGDEVALLSAVDKSFGKNAIYDHLDFLVRRKERWCVMGENGAGKSTLLKMIAGGMEPDAGTVTIGPSVKLGYFAQHSLDVLDGEKTVAETLSYAFPRASVGALRTLAGCFSFPGDDVEKRVRHLSGGEKARLVLALMIYDPPNFLVLDEPTNHLDASTQTMLVEVLQNYEGAMIFVSHDRRFLRALSTCVLELTPQGPVTYPGGYAEYVAASGHEAPGLRVT